MMKYSVSPESLGSVFMVPCLVAEKHLKLATPLQLKVLLHIFANLSGGIDAEKTAEALNAQLCDVIDALDFWKSAGILKGESAEKPEADESKSAPKISLPTRTDVIRRGNEDKNVAVIMREAQKYFGCSISQNVSSYLLSLYDDCGMSVSLILYLLAYAAKEDKCNLSFIRNLSNDWIKCGVTTVLEAEERLAAAAREDLAWQVVRKAFGIEKRKPSTKEKETSNRWINEWNISPELLKAAYDKCVDTKSKFSFSYVSAIIEAWHTKGIKTPKEAEEKDRKITPAKNGKKYGYGGYDLDKFNEMINKD